MPSSHTIARVSDVPPGTAKEVLAGEQVLALFNVGGTFYALDGICPHAGGPLAEGVLRGNIVTCPWHGWQFDVDSGRNCLNPRVSHVGYPVRVEGDAVIVEIP